MVKISKENIKQLADRSGHPPIIMPNDAPPFVAEQVGKTRAEITVEDQLIVAEKFGYVASIDPFFAPLTNLIPKYRPELQWQEEKEEDKTEVKSRRWIKTPHGNLSEQTLYHKQTGMTVHIEKIIKNEADLKAMTWIIEESVRTFQFERNAIKKEIMGDLFPQAAMIRGRGLSMIHFWTPITEVLFPFFDQTEMIYAMADYPKLMRRLMDLVLPYAYFQIEVGRDAGVDAMQTALWGYEQWSPQIYEEFVIPYAVQISREVRDKGLLFWVHTCGRMKGLLEQKIYHRFGGLDILESLNYPPAGDVDDWPRLRRMLPEETVSKGNLEDSLLWQGPVEEIRKKTLEILRESEGFKHIFSTANGIFEGTPALHMQAMISAVQEYNRRG